MYRSSMLPAVAFVTDIQARWPAEFMHSYTDGLSSADSHHHAVICVLCWVRISIACAHILHTGVCIHLVLSQTLLDWSHLCGCLSSADLLGFIGALGFGPTTYSLPSIFWLLVKKPKITNWHFWASWACIIAGVIITIFGAIGGMRGIIVDAKDYKFYT